VRSGRERANLLQRESEKKERREKKSEERQR